MKKLFPYILFFFIYVSIVAKAQSNNESNVLEKKIFSVESLKRHLSFLGSDLFEGRGLGSTGESLASKYLALELNMLGVKPIGDNGTYYQHIPFHSNIPLRESDLKLIINDTIHKLNYLDDYVLLKTGPQTFIPSLTEMVFVGYGITAPEYDYNDYQYIDADGKIVVMLGGEPQSDDTVFFDGPAPTVYSYYESKIRTALSHGARGSIIIPTPLDYYYSDWEKIKKNYSFEDISLAYTPAGNFAVLINPNLSKILFDNSDFSFENIMSMHFENKMKSFPLKLKMTFNGKFKRRDFISSNVVGIIEGSDPELKNTYLIISAHYDHLGIGTPVKGDSIYNGVLDNAMGTSGVLELAKAISLMDKAPKRSIIFMFVTGEEEGALGSSYYTDHPLVPLFKTVADVNVDGLAFIDNFKSVVCAGCELSELGNILKKTLKSHNLFETSIPPEFRQYESYNFSDQISFAKAGVPAVLIMDGPDYVHISREEGINRLIDYSQNYYHSPFDDLSQKINYNASVQHLEFLLSFCLNIANSDVEPQWYKDSPFINARLRSRAERK